MYHKKGENMKKYLAYSLVAIGLLSGCGGSDSSSSSSTQTGVFVDAPVAGLTYSTTSGLSGTTNDKGEFTYNTGDSVTFKLGSLSLGTAAAGSVVTPRNLGDEIVATNVAYILQNLDTDGDATNDVIKLPDSKTLETILASYQISDLKDPADIEAKVRSIKEEVEAQLNVDCPDVDFYEALSNMDQNLQGIYKVSDLIGKSFVVIESEPLIGGKIGADEARLNSDGTLYVKAFWGEESVPYEIVRDDILYSIWDDGEYHDYKKILYISDGVSAVCSFSSDHELSSEELDEAALSCSEIDSYFVEDATKANEILETLQSNAKLKTKTQITSFSDLQDQMFYQFNGLLGVEAFKITDNDVTWYYADNSQLDNVVNESMSADSTLNDVASFQDNKILLSDREGEEWTNNVYKYSLSGVTITSQEFAEETIFDDGGIAYNLPNTTFSFTKGNMYCTMYYDECWLDQDAIVEVINQLP